jgi:hypothetical protein
MKAISMKAKTLIRGWLICRLLLLNFTGACGKVRKSLALAEQCRKISVPKLFRLTPIDW